MRKLITILFTVLTFIGHGQFVINPYSFATSSSGDADVDAYISATGITDPTTTTAITNLVSSLKSNSLWTLGKLINPLPGATAAINKYNLKDPRDLDAAYRLVFTGTVSHTATGITGSTAYANTFLNPNTDYPTGFMSMGVYSRTNTAGTYVDIGALSATNRYTQIYANLAGNFYGQVNTNNSISESVSNSDSRGWFFACRTASTSAFIQKNSTQTTGFTTGTLVTNNNIYVMAQNNAGTAAFFTPREIAFIWIGDALTTGQASTLYTIIQAYQTTMARQL